MAEEQPNTINPYLPSQAMIAEAMGKARKKTTPSLFDEKKFREMLPAEMLSEKRWVRFFLKPKEGGGTAKVPLGNHSDPNTWSTFSECVKAIENDQQGIGYCFYKGEIQAADVDHCRNPKTGIICNEVMLLMERLKPCWAELSVSGNGVHLLGYDNTLRHTKPITKTCLQAWPSQHSARFFALTCEMLSEVDVFRQLGDWKGQLNYVYSDAARISAKIREELKTVDREQWEKLPVEHEPVETVTREKSKTKTRKVHKEFNIKDFLSFYGLGVDNETDNELGHCIRVNTCPIKGDSHVGQNSTTTNFILSTDGGLGFKCQSTGCVDSTIHDVIKKLAEDKGPYPNKIYEEKQQPSETIRSYRRVTAEGRKLGHKVWLWPGYLFGNQLVHLAGDSGQGKSPLTRDLIARFTSGSDWPDGTKNDSEPARRGVLLLSSEDDWETDILPHLKFAGADLSKVHEFVSTITKGDDTYDVVTALDEDVKLMEQDLEEHKDIGLIVIDPVTNYLGRQGMNKEDQLRPNILMPLANLAHKHKVCVVTVGHLNKAKDGQGGDLLSRVLGARAFVGVARQTLFCSGDREEENRFAHIIGLGRGSNVPNLKYCTTEQTFENEWNVVVIEWHGKSEADIEESVTSPSKQSERSADAQVQVLIKTLLRDGAKPTAVIEAAIKEQGIGCANWQRAAKKVAKSTQVKGKQHGGWQWYLPAPEQGVFDNNERRPPQKEERISA